MSATYLQRGESLDYKNTTSSTIEYGTIIAIGTRVGVAAADIPAGEVGAIDVEGVFEMPKAADEISMGDDLYYDSSAKNVTTTSKTAKAGYAIADAESDAATVYVKLLG